MQLSFYLDQTFFDICFDRIGEPKSLCIIIGDSLSSDMLDAQNAFIDSVWFMPSENKKNGEM